MTETKPVAISAGRATLAGMVALLSWASLSLLTHIAGPVPPLQLLALSFTVASLIGFFYVLATGMRATGLDPRLRKLEPGAFVLGVYGLFGYHFCFFVALQNAPVLPATLINYLWPILILLLSALLPAGVQGGRLRWWHLVGAAMGFAGAALVLVAGRAGIGGGDGIGYLAAFGAALIWSSYSVASRLFARVPTQAVTFYCLATAAAAWAAHFMFEATRWPVGSAAWLAVLLLGVGPVGGAFFFWDVGMKHGDMRRLGVFSYFVPLLSVVLLIFAGISEPAAAIWLAAGLIIGGALVASKDLLALRRPR